MYSRARMVPNDSIRLMRFVCWISKSVHTHSEYVIIIALFPRQQWLRERLSMLRYTCIVCLVLLGWQYFGVTWLTGNPFCPITTPERCTCFFIILKIQSGLHLVIIVFFYQLHEQVLYLNAFITFLYMFRALLCSFSGGQIVLVQHLVSSHSLGDCSVHRLREDS